MVRNEARLDTDQGIGPHQMLREEALQDTEQEIANH